MAHCNPGCEYDSSWFKDIHIDLAALNRRADTLKTKRCVKKAYQAAWLVRAATCIDLTTLAGDDTDSNVQRLCFKAATPIRPDLVKHLGMEGYNLTTGAVCVYPNQVKSAVKWLKLTGKEIPVASVATGFPAGQTPLRLRLEEIREAVADGATEIDIVINRTMALQGNWRGVYDEVKQMKEACGTAHMKAILGVGELGTMENIYKASMVCMQAGSDFIKTSTGKESVNATLPIGLVMVRAIREFLQRTGVKVGFKPAGGIRTAKDSLAWLSLMKEELGNDYVKGDLFRIGASSLLIDVERQLYHYCYGRYAAAHQLAMS